MIRADDVRVGRSGQKAAVGLGEAGDRATDDGAPGCECGGDRASSRSKREPGI